MNFLTETLDNGLTVAAEVNPEAASMAQAFLVMTGSRDESPEVSGVSHFLEHMVFKGSDGKTGLDVNRQFDELGANYNAATCEETTIFYGAVLPEYQDRLQALLAEILRPALREEDFQTEKQVILDEIALYKDDPYFRLYDAVMAQHFRGHPLGNMILGTNASISDMTAQQMRDYFQSHYAAENITLVATGNVDFPALVQGAGRHCGHWPGGKDDRSTPPARTQQSRQAIRDEKLLRQQIGLSCQAPDARDPKRYAAELLSALVGDSSSSRLYYALIDTGLADHASMHYRPMDHAGMFMTTICCSPQNPGKVLSIAMEELRRFCKDGPSEGELQAAKNKIASGATLKGEIPMGRLSSVATDWVYAQRYQTLQESIQCVFDVTREQVMQVARQYAIDQVDQTALGPAEDFLGG